MLCADGPGPANDGHRRRPLVVLPMHWLDLSGRSGRDLQAHTVFVDT